MEEYSDTTPQGASTRRQTLLEISVPAEARNVALIRRSVRRMLGSMPLSVQKLDDIMLALGEACNNAVIHASDIHGQIISITCSVAADSPNTLIIDIMNLGTMLVDILSDKLFSMPSAELMGEHGRGLPLIHSLVDRVDVFANGNTTVVRLEKRI